jgi:hypothetical protein
MQRSNFGTFLQSLLDINILRSDRYSECFLVVINWEYMLAYINYLWLLCSGSVVNINCRCSVSIIREDKLWYSIFNFPSFSDSLTMTECHKFPQYNSRRIEIKCNYNRKNLLKEEVTIWPVLICEFLIVAKIYQVYRALLAATDCVYSSLAGNWEFMWYYHTYFASRFWNFSDTVSTTQVV